MDRHMDIYHFLKPMADWLHPDRLLNNPGATGAGVSIAVIDSGVDAAMIAQRQLKRGKVALPMEAIAFRPEQTVPLTDPGTPASPHGTVVADILLTMAPDARLYSADVFGPTGTCEVETVVRAIDHAIHVWKCKIINLSLGIPESRLQQLPKRHQLLRAVEQGYHKDVLIFAAAHNEHPITRSYPSMFAPPLISVDKGTFTHGLGFAYNPRESVEFEAFSKGYLGPFAKEAATSWATPHLAGVAARLLSLHPNMKPFEIKTLLYWMTLLKEHATVEGPTESPTA
jgi:subtilisin